MVKVFPSTYVDSVLQLGATRAMAQTKGVKWASAAMATVANVEVLAAQGIDVAQLSGARANDLFLAVLAATPIAAAAALEAGMAVLFAPHVEGRSVGDGGRLARSVAEACRQLGGAANVAVVSVPGPYAAIEAYKALTAGLHVLLFSDNVSVGDEIELKDRAVELGLLVMGPGAGTAVLGGTALGFANMVRSGRVGVVAAAGTGAQEAMSLLDQWGAGVSHVIGVGGRDLSQAVAGRMTLAAVAALEADPGTDAILVISKPPAPEVAQTVLGAAGQKPLVAALIGHGAPAPAGARVVTVSTLEAGVVAVMAVLGLDPPDSGTALLAQVEAACAGLPDQRTLIRGLYSGGTLCHEALSLLAPLVGPVCSNVTPGRRGTHLCLDLGEEEYTRGRPHPMIDPEARIELMREAGRHPQVAVILVDVVLGYGSHPDPAGVLAPVAREIMADGQGPQVVAYVLGTDGDPQDLAGQRAALRAAGCIVPPTATRAVLAAAALATRRPELVLALP